MISSGFDICIPTWNSLNYLKLAIQSIRENSCLPRHRIFVHDNGSTDGTLDWLSDQRIIYTHTKDNQGFCAVNHCLRSSDAEQVMIFNADMIVLPGWDMEILKQINAFKRRNIQKYTISCCLVEPVGNNPEYDIINFGTDFKSFDNDMLKHDFKLNKSRYMREDTVQYSHPILMPNKMMLDIGFLDTDYFPGWAVDHDIAARAYYRAGCRHFVMLGKSRVYHFSSKTFDQLPNNVRNLHGEDIFQRKWNMTVKQFRDMIGIRKEYAHSF